MSIKVTEVPEITPPTPELEQRQPDPAQADATGQPQPGDTLSQTRTIKGGKVYEWPGVVVSGLAQPATVKFITSDADGQTEFEVNGRPIRYDGPVTFGGSRGQPITLTLPENWDYAQGQSRHAFSPPLTLGSPAQFEITAASLGRDSTITVNGQPLHWASRATLDIPARGLSQLVIEAPAVQGVAKGTALTQLVLTAIGSKDHAVSSESSAEEVLAIIAERLEVPEADLIKGSWVVDTEDGPRLATFVMVLNNPLAVAPQTPRRPTWDDMAAQQDGVKRTVAAEGTVYTLSQVAVSGLSEPADVEIMAPAEAGQSPRVRVDGRAIEFDGKIGVVTTGEKVTGITLLPHWRYAREVAPVGAQ